MTYLAPVYSQIDGTKYALQNCVPATTTELIDAASVGRFRIPAWKIRNASKDTFGGIEYTQAAITANTLTRGAVSLTPRRVTDWQDVLGILERSAAGFIIDCAKTVKTPYRTNRFTGIHSGQAPAQTPKDGRLLFEDPGTTSAGYLRWPVKLLREASELRGFHFLLVAPATEDVDKEARIRCAIRAEPSMDGKVLAHLDPGDGVHVIRTRKGGPWRRDDGTVAHGWHVIRFRKGRAFVKGMGLA